MSSRGSRMLLAGVATAAALSAWMSPAAADSATQTRSSWDYGYTVRPDDGDAGGKSLVVWAQNSDYEGVSADFNALGGHLYVYDNFDNGRPAIAKLWVGGSGPAVFYAPGDEKSKHFDLSYDENQTVYLQVCTSDSPNAVCTVKSKGKGRT